MNITVTAEKTQDNELKATVVVPAEEVKSQVAKTYKEIAGQYNFQGFRRGRAPRPVVDGVLGKDAVLAQATNSLVDAAQPQILNELDIVPVGQPNLADDAKSVEDAKEYTFVITYTLRPEAELDSYDAPEINMPPEDATDAEVEWQIRQLMKYQAKFENTTSKRKVSKNDVIGVTIENVEGAEHLERTDAVVDMSNGYGLPEEVRDALIGMKPGETKEVEWTHEHEHEGETHKHEYKVNVTVTAHKEEVVPELTDENAKETFGYDTAEEVRAELRKEIEADKKQSLVNLKEDRVVEEVGKRLQLEEVPADYLESVYNELAQEFLANLQQQGLSLDMFLASRQIQIQDFIADLRAQADERARQALALDAIVRKEGLEASMDEVREEFEKAGVEDVDAAVKDWEAQGRIPAIRESIRRTKALRHLVDTAVVTIKDEIAERLAEDDAQSAKTSKKSKKDAEEAEATE